MTELKGFQRRYLKGLAHDMKPVVYIGQNGVTTAIEKALNEAFDTHELIKLKFLEFKKKEQKEQLTHAIRERTGCAIVGIIGHIAILYRRHKDAGKRKIRVPVREQGA